MRQLLTLVVGILVVLVPRVPAHADERPSDSLTAQVILDRMARVYSGCGSYRDTGVVKTTFIEVAGPWTVEKPFRTAFVRPGRFRFEYTDTWCGREARCIVWREEEDVRTWWSVKAKVEKAKSLGLALAGATGVSGGSAHTIPSLLLPKEVGGRRLTDLAEAKRLADAALGEADHFRIEGRYGDATMTLWIDKKTFLVRRIDTNAKLGNVGTEQTTTYDPVIDEDIPDESLEFDAPQGK